jgi:hypothetical protein
LPSCVQCSSGFAKKGFLPWSRLGQHPRDQHRMALPLLELLRQPHLPQSRTLRWHCLPRLLWQQASKQTKTQTSQRPTNQTKPHNQATTPQSPPDVDNHDSNVWVTARNWDARSGKFHRIRECQGVVVSRRMIQVSRDAAVARGITSCLVCSLGTFDLL